MIRWSNKPQVALVGFKSGEPESNKNQKLDEDETLVQVALYAVAARKELECQPELGLVRYLHAESPAKAELQVSLDARAVSAATNLMT